MKNSVLNEKKTNYSANSDRDLERQKRQTLAETIKKQGLLPTANKSRVSICHKNLEITGPGPLYGGMADT